MSFLKKLFRKKMDKTRVRENVETLLDDEEACATAATEAFAKCDTKGTGVLDKKQADKAINTLIGAQENEKGIPKHLIKEFIKDLDYDGEGGISQEEFVTAAWDILSKYHEKELAKEAGEAEPSDDSGSEEEFEEEED